MASSSTNPSQESDDIKNKSDRSSKTSDEKQPNDLSPHLILKRSSVPLAAPCFRPPTTLERSRRGLPESDLIRARPFEEILVGQPNTDVPPGTSTKPGDDN